MPDIDLAHLTNLAAALAEQGESYAADDAPDVTTALVPQGYDLKTVSPAVAVRHLRTAPRRVRGEAVVTDTTSWLAYYDKYAGPHTEVYGDVHTSTVTAVLNAPATADNPAWGDHRVTLKLEKSAAWKAWIDNNEKQLTQVEFAEHLENRTPDLRTPDAATMLELAQHFHATNGLKFESGSQLHSGQRRFTYMETVEARAGERGDLDIPTEIEIEVQPWRGVAIVVPMTARFRFRTGPQGLKLTYVLDRLEDTLDAAWSELLGQLMFAGADPDSDQAVAAKLMVLAGRAPQYGAE